MTTTKQIRERQKRQMGIGARYEVDHRSFDNILMTAKARDSHQDREIKIRFTWVWAPKLTAYNETDGCWLTSTDWVWVNQIQTCTC